MVDRSIKIDAPTDRLVTDLAYFLRSSKRSILHDAVAEFAETHHPRFLATRSGVDRVGAAEAVSERADQFAQECVAGPIGPGRGGGLVRPEAGVEAGEARAEVGAQARAEAGAEARAVTFEMLDPFDRLSLRRRELLRQFAEHGGTNVRVLDPDEKDSASGESASGIVLLAETDPVDGSAAVPALEEVARRVLGVHTTVVSLTALRMFGSGRIDEALAESRPL